jgi:glycosyltransferase involved in cell wall biosynthesis
MVKLSLAIPYKQRLDNLRIVFEGLANQTMDRAQFEVLVGAMEYSEEYLSACREFTDRIDIVSVMSASEFDCSYARNLAMRQATGEIVVQMNADTLLPPRALQDLYDRYFAAGQNVCVAGQMIGYGNNRDGDIVSVERRSYESYLAEFREIEDSLGHPRDMRFQVDHVIPWTFAWTGFIGLPMDTVRKYGLFFDEELHGWGVEDLEWGYRICASGTPITLREDVYCIDLPHIRDMKANAKAARANWRRFLRKWPSTEVELGAAFGDVEANPLFFDFQRELAHVSGGEGRKLGTVRGVVDGNDVLVVGAVVDAEGSIIDPELTSLFEELSRVEVLPLAGLCLPYEDASVGECRVLPRIGGFSGRYRDVIRAEAERVCPAGVVQARSIWGRA